MSDPTSTVRARRHQNTAHQPEEVQCETHCFILGIRTPLRATPMPASARMTSNRPGNFPSRSLIRYRALHPGHQQLAVTRRYPHAGFSRTSPPHQDTNRVHGTRPARVPGPGPLGVPARDRTAVPAEYGVRAHHQVQSLEHVPREPVQQCRQQRPVTRGEPHPARTELPLQDKEIYAMLPLWMADGLPGSDMSTCG